MIIIKANQSIALVRIQAFINHPLKQIPKTMQFVIFSKIFPKKQIIHSNWVPHSIHQKSLEYPGLRMEKWFGYSLSRNSAHVMPSVGTLRSYSWRRFHEQPRVKIGFNISCFLCIKSGFFSCHSGCFLNGIFELIFL